MLGVHRLVLAWNSMGSLPHEELTNVSNRNDAKACRLVLLDGERHRPVGTNFFFINWADRKRCHGQHNKSGKPEMLFCT
jgi:hypothetical protein